RSKRVCKSLLALVSRFPSLSRFWRILRSRCSLWLRRLATLPLQVNVFGPMPFAIAGIEPAGLQLGQFVAAADVVQANRELVADQLATMAGEDRRTTGETCPLLLAIAGRRASDAAAVRGHARPDRAATDTDGIALGEVSRSESGYSGWGKEKCCKSGRNPGPFRAVLLRMADRRECSRRKVVLRCCEQARRVYYGTVSETKKEILVNLTYLPKGACYGWQLEISVLPSLR